MSAVEPDVSKALQMEIQQIEQGTDLKRVAVISRIGMKIASALSSQMDADAETASSSALIELAERLTSSINHGHLREIVVKADSGFIILQFINKEFMLFGGIENPLRVGFYLEYIRNIAHRFAYILAGNEITEELKHEIEVNKNRDQRLHEEMGAPLAANFQMDKSTNQDMEAMQGVLSFLDEWGEEEQSTPANEQNIVSIDQDLTFDFGDLSPQPISQEQLTQAQQTQSIPSQEDESMSESFDLTDLSQLADELAEESVERQEIERTVEPISQEPPIQAEITAETVSESEEGLPDDILAALDEIAKGTSFNEPSKKPPSRMEAQSKPKYQYGVPLYEGEVPPIPLEDYVNFEIGSLTSQGQPTETMSTQEPSSLSSGEDLTQIETNEYNESPVNITLKEDGSPDFDAMSSEYDELGIDEEEDAMLMALEELNLTESPTKKKKSAKDSNNNPFLL